MVAVGVAASVGGECAAADERGAVVGALRAVRLASAQRRLLSVQASCFVRRVLRDCVGTRKQHSNDLRLTSHVC